MRRAAAVGALALLPACIVVPAHADPTPTLPPVTQKIPGDTKVCLAPSGAPLAGVPWAEEYLRISEVTARATGRGVTIGLVDTGTALSADPSLAAKVRVLPPAYGPKAAARPDCVGHGTAMASLIGSSGGGVRGLAPGASIVSIKATNDFGNTDGAHLAASISAVVAAGASIVAVGTGVSTPSPELSAAVDAARAKGVLVVAPARFDAQTDKGAVYPAALDGVLSVGDVGPAAAIRTDVPTGAPIDLAAPGDLLVALGHDGAGEVTGSGPSYAVAYVAAAAALVAQYHPGSTGTALAQRLLGGATPPAGGSVPDPSVGAGVLDPAAALDVEFGTGSAMRVAAPPPVRAQPAEHTGMSAASIVAGSAGIVLLLSIGTAGSVVARRRRLAATA